jgi:hypothetical protein
MADQSSVTRTKIFLITSREDVHVGMALQRDEMVPHTGVRLCTRLGKRSVSRQCLRPCEAATRKRERYKRGFGRLS